MGAHRAAPLAGCRGAWPGPPPRGRSRRRGPRSRGRPRWARRPERGSARRAPSATTAWTAAIARSPALSSRGPGTPHRRTPSPLDRASRPMKAPVLSARGSTRVRMSAMTWLRPPRAGIAEEFIAVPEVARSSAACRRKRPARPRWRCQRRCSGAASNPARSPGPRWSRRRDHGAAGIELVGDDLDEHRHRRHEEGRNAPDHQIDHGRAGPTGRVGSAVVSRPAALREQEGREAGRHDDDRRRRGRREERVQRRLRDGPRR